MIKVPKKIAGVDIDVKFYVYKTKTEKYLLVFIRSRLTLIFKRYMITRVNTKGNSSSTPHALFSVEDMENEDENEVTIYFSSPSFLSFLSSSLLFYALFILLTISQVLATAEKIFAGYTSDVDKNAWRRVLSHLFNTFEANKKKEKQESIFYRPSWFDGDLFLPLFELKVGKSGAEWQVQVVKTTRQLKFKQVTEVKVDGTPSSFLPPLFLLSPSSLPPLFLLSPSAPFDTTN